MAVKNAMFLFEVSVQSVNYMTESRYLIIKGDFADIFSLQLKDPKKMNIIMPDPLPLPPEPVGKKGKKKAKPKPKKGKKGKKGAVELPPPEPEILCGQSVLFANCAEVIYRTMEEWPLVLSLWSKEDHLIFIGASRIPWDPIFLQFLQKIIDCQEPPPVSLKEEYNVFQERTPKIMAKVTLYIKLSYLSAKVTTSFRTLSEDPTIKKFLYTGLNSRTTSYICTMKTTEEAYLENCKRANDYAVDIHPTMAKPIAYADYRNAPCTKVSFFNEGDICCMGHVDKPPDSIYKAPDTCPSIDFIIDYVRKIIVSCNDNMRMLTPRPTIKPRVKATDIDRLCYCRETAWPEGKLAERFKKDVQTGPCPMCMEAGKKETKIRGDSFDIACIRGPCGRPDCRIAKDMRAYIENLVNEDNVEFNINDIIGPCGSKKCTIAEKIHEFLRHEGVFTEGQTLEGLSTQCACTQKMQQALTVKKESCASLCSKECSEAESDDTICGGKSCPFIGPTYNVYYFTVEYDFEKNSPPVSSGPSSVGKSSVTSKSSKTSTNKSSKFQHCAPDCPTAKLSDENMTCTHTTCAITPIKTPVNPETKCREPVCPAHKEFPPSPADSNIVIEFDEIRNPCCVKSCDMAEKIKELIVDGTTHKSVDKDHCFCDCTCDIHFNRNTTYCAVCGGFESLGDDMKEMPEFMKPLPCPVYHKLYDKNYIKVVSPFPDEVQEPTVKDSRSSKGTKSSFKAGASIFDRKSGYSRYSSKLVAVKKVPKKAKPATAKKQKGAKKKIGKFTANVVETSQALVLEKKPNYKYPYPAVPKHMGWNWNAEDIPGMKPRPHWKPGAALDVLVRRYRALRGEGIDLALKKKRALLQRKKKIEMRPTLIVTKQKYGEYRVHLEVLKKYSKERLLFQYPYDEKPPLVYTIGKTEEEKYKMKKQQDRKDRRETRRKRRYLQSSFRDKCQEICLKAYNQALGVLPLPNPNSPDCPCHTDKDPRLTPPIDSCSCSDEGTISSSDTDGDEWVIEFTPPVARWDPKAKHPPVIIDEEVQYNYLDYKVKLFDRTGNPVARYFKGPDGKQECSDLGGFWGPGKVWLEINKDGYVGIDDRWVPMNFIGPDGLNYSAEDGVFVDSTANQWKIGVDGYIDVENKWCWYHKARRGKPGKPTGNATQLPKFGHVPAGARQETSPKGKGDGGASSPPKSKIDSKKPHSPPTEPHAPVKSHGTVAKKHKNPIVMNVSLNYNKKNRMARFPPSKGGNCVDPKTLAKYREIMNGLQSYEDLQFRPITKTNRACNTGRKESTRMRTRHGKNLNTDKKSITSEIPTFSEVQ